MKKLLVLFITFAITFGQQASQEGTTSGNFAKIPLWASSIAKSNTGVSYANGVEALFYNPAGIIGSSEVGFGVQEHFADIQTNFLGFTFDFEGSAIGVQMSFNDVGDIQQTTWDDQEGKTLSDFTVSQMVLGLTYASQLTDRIKGGITLKTISESVLSVSATAIALDAGIQYQFDENYSLGLALKNLGSKMEYTGGGLNINTPLPGDANNPDFEVVPDVKSANLPTSFEIGLAYHHDLDENSYIQTSTTFTIDNAAENLLFGGVEYGYDMFMLRGGYDFSTSWIDNVQYDYSFGFGLNLDLSSTSKISVDYAYAHAAEFFEDLNMFSLRLSF